MKKIVLLLFILLTGCSRKQETPEELVARAETILIAEYDGCKVYRTDPAAYSPIYWVKCGNETTTQHTRSCGKGCSHTERVQVFP